MFISRRWRFSAGRLGKNCQMRLCGVSRLDVGSRSGDLCQIPATKLWSATPGNGILERHHRQRNSGAPPQAMELWSATPGNGTLERPPRQWNSGVPPQATELWSATAGNGTLERPPRQWNSGVPPKATELWSAPPGNGTKIENGTLGDSTRQVMWSSAAENTTWHG